MQKSLIPLAMFVALSAVVAGCGGGSATKTVTASQTVTAVETVTAAAATDAISGPSADPPTTATTAADTAKILDRKIAQVGGDGHLLFKVTGKRLVQSVPQEYEQPFRAVAGAKLLLVTAIVKNNGQTSVTPFCGGSETALIDSKARNFEILDDEMINMPDNALCTDLQPGFSATFNLLFQVPADARPTGVAFWDSDDADDFLGDTSWVRFAL